MWRILRVVPYLTLWLLAGGLLTLLLVGTGGLHPLDALAVAFPPAAVYAFVCLSAWYVARSMPLGGTQVLRVVVTATLAAVLSSAAWLGLGRAWIELLGSRRETIAAAQLPGVDALMFGFGLLLYLLSLSVSYLLVTAGHAREAEQRSLQAQLLSREAELRSLRAQIDPHFLFNSLHSISALTTADPPGARRMCLLLADFLRDSLALGAEVRIPLARELELAGRFLEVERVRFGDRLRVVMDAGDAGACLVPPLVLQPLVENAVTHGIAHAVAGGTVRVSAVCTTGRLTIVVENPADPERPRKPGTGVGLANVRSRLRALFGAEASVHWGEQDGRWRVELALPAIRG